MDTLGEAFARRNPWLVVVLPLHVVLWCLTWARVWHLRWQSIFGRRHMWLVNISAAFGALLTTMICLREAVGAHAFPCGVYITVVVVCIPGYVMPFFLRAWVMYATFLINERERILIDTMVDMGDGLVAPTTGGSAIYTVYDHDTCCFGVCRPRSSSASAPPEPNRTPYLMSKWFLGWSATRPILAAVFVVAVLTHWVLFACVYTLRVLMFSLVTSAHAWTCTTCSCRLGEDVFELFFVLGAVYLAMLLTSIALLRQTRDAYHIHGELKAVFTLWTLLGSAFVMLNLDTVLYHHVNTTFFPVAALIVCMLSGTFAMTVVVPCFLAWRERRRFGRRSAPRTVSEWQRIDVGDESDDETRNAARHRRGPGPSVAYPWDHGAGLAPTAAAMDDGGAGTAPSMEMVAIGGATPSVDSTSTYDATRRATARATRDMFNYGADVLPQPGETAGEHLRALLQEEALPGDDAVAVPNDPSQAVAQVVTSMTIYVPHCLLPIMQGSAHPSDAGILRFLSTSELKSHFLHYLVEERRSTLMLVWRLIREIEDATEATERANLMRRLYDHYLRSDQPLSADVLADLPIDADGRYLSRMLVIRQQMTTEIHLTPAITQTLLQPLALDVLTAVRLAYERFQTTEEYKRCNVT